MRRPSVNTERRQSLRPSRLRRATLYTLFVLTTALIAIQPAGASEWAIAIFSDSPIAAGMANSVHPTADGGFVVGFSRWDEGQEDGFLKLDAAGNVLRSRHYSMEGLARYSLMIPAAAGGYILAGFNFVGQQSNVRRLDAEGNILWNASYGAAMPIAVAEAAGGGIVVVGEAPAGGATVPWILALDANGAVVWEKTYGEQGSFSAVMPIADGYLVAGATAYPTSSDADAWVLKLDRSGDVLWQRAYGGTRPDVAKALLPAQGGGYLVAGQTASFGAGGGDGWLLWLDEGGAIRRQQTYGGAGWDYFRHASSVNPSLGGGYLLAGETSSFGAGSYDGWLVRLDADGGILWQRTFGGDSYDFAGAAQPTMDGGYVAVGFTLSHRLNRPADAWVAKLGSDGALPGCATVAASSATVGTSLATFRTTAADARVRNGSAAAAHVAVADVASTVVLACSQTPLNRVNVAEYHHAGLDHYFMTSLSQEQFVLANDPGAGWRYTGQGFVAYGISPGTVPVCRFWSGQSYAPTSTHFYTSDATECATLRNGRAWIYEGATFALKPPGVMGYACEQGLVPVFRLYNDGRGGVPNHRYTTSLAVRSEMIAQGWRPEGVGVGMIGCAQAP